MRTKKNRLRAAERKRSAKPHDKEHYRRKALKTPWRLAINDAMTPEDVIVDRDGLPIVRVEWAIGGRSTVITEAIIAAVNAMESTR